MLLMLVKLSLTLVKQQKCNIFQLFTLHYVVLLANNTTTFNVAFISFVFDYPFSLCIGYIKAFIDIASAVFMLILQFEICWMKYWIEFNWKHIKPIDDRFVINSIIVINLFMSSFASILGIMESGGIQPITLGTSSSYDRLISMNRNDGFFPRYYYFFSKMCNH